jgi:predicted Fe-Mo cluster-binding NifX family protein
MKVAIPIRNGRVSPVFDTARRVILVEFEGGVPTGRSEFSIREGGNGARVELLQDLGVSTLICGAISNHIARIVERCGIELLPWVVGDIDEVIDAYCGGSLGTDGFIMPGCRRRQGRRNIRRGENRRRAGEGNRRWTGGRRNED